MENGGLIRCVCACVAGHSKRNPKFQSAAKGISYIVYQSIKMLFVSGSFFITVHFHTRFPGPFTLADG